LPLLVVKRDGTRQRFDREKLRSGLLKACDKTTITATQIERIMAAVENELSQQEETEIESRTIGNLAARELKRLDKIAYIRFASVFRRFVDLEDFEKELKKLL
jgi:transcriptional repressor NrdR